MAENHVVLRAWFSGLDGTVAKRENLNHFSLLKGSCVKMNQGRTGPRLISNAYYTLQVDRCGPDDDPDKWRLTVTRCASDGSSVSEQQLHFERLFDSHQEAVQYGSTWASVQRALVIHAAAVMRLRWSFRWYGFDVSAYNDDQVSMALVEAAKTQPSVDLFPRAFQRLRRVEPNQG